MSSSISFSDPLISHLHVLNLAAAYQDASGVLQAGYMNFGRSFAGVNNTNPSNLGNGDYGQFIVSGVAGESIGANYFSFETPLTISWFGSMGWLPENCNYGLFVGENAHTATINSTGYGIRVIDNNTVQLVIGVSGAITKSDYTINGLLPGTSSTSPNRVHFILRWNGSSELSLYVAFNGPGSVMREPSFIGNVEQPVSGPGISFIRFGVYSTGTSAVTAVNNNPMMMAYTVMVREG